MAEKEYIEREAAKMAVVEAIGKGHSPFNAIVMLPAADVRPVVRGKWIKYAPYNSDMMTCSECEKYWIFDGDQYDYHYCHNCGADMRGEQDV
jgi:hypothetical protein